MKSKPDNVSCRSHILESRRSGSINIRLGILGTRQQRTVLLIESPGAEAGTWHGRMGSKRTTPVVLKDMAEKWERTGCGGYVYQFPPGTKFFVHVTISCGTAFRGRVMSPLKK